MLDRGGIDLIAFSLIECYDYNLVLLFLALSLIELALEPKNCTQIDGRCIYSSLIKLEKNWKLTITLILQIGMIYFKVNTPFLNTTMIVVVMFEM